MSSFHFVLGIIFLVVVVPTWMHYHYGRDRKRGPVAAPTDDGELIALRDTAARLEERVRTLERVLDAEAPDWRSKI